MSHTGGEALGMDMALMPAVSIQPSGAERIDEFRRYWDAARAFQSERALPLSPVFPEELIRAEIGEGMHFMGLRSADTLCAGFFSLTSSDPIIWGERERGDAVYIHRMCVNPAARGSRFSSHVLQWAYEHAARLGLAHVRMDTWGSNEALVAYYRSCGFELVGYQAIGSEPSLSSHYHGITLALFENPVATRPLSPMSLP